MFRITGRTLGRALHARLLPLLLGAVALALVVPLVVGGPPRAAPRTAVAPARAVVPVRSPTAATEPTTTTSTTTTSTTTTPTSTTTAPVAPPAVTTGCADALAYLAAHQAPGFVDRCGPGSALGHDGFTCWNTPGTCPDGAKVIAIACPAPFVYMNEAHNSWSLQGLRTGIDPFGQGSPAERQFCDRFR